MNGKSFENDFLKLATSRLSAIPVFRMKNDMKLAIKTDEKKFTQIGTSAKIFKESTNCLLNYQGKEKGAGICVILSDHYLQKKTSNCS